MAETLKLCSCGRTFTDAQSSGDTCFKCKLATVGFTWRGVRDTRESFSTETIPERIRETESMAAANGVEVEPVGTRWV
jgi:hypothetical protein